MHRALTRASTTMTIAIALATAGIAASASPASAANIVVNPGFEANPPHQTHGPGTSAGWTLGGGALSFIYGGGDGPFWDALVHTGHGAYISGCIGEVGCFATATVGQDLHTTPGTDYQLDYWLGNNEATTGHDAGVQVHWGGLIVQTIYDPPGGSVLHPAFTHETLFVRATSFVTNLTFGLYQNPAWASIDDISVQAIPEPSSLALLGVGLVGLVAGRRRRR